MKIQVRVDNLRFPTFNWLLTGGTGAYEDLHANGRGFAGIPILDGQHVIGVWDVYEGKAH